MSSASARTEQVVGHLAAKPGGLLKGETAIITGAAQGANVVVCDLDGSKAQKVVDEIKAQGGKAIAVVADVTADDFAKSTVKATIDAFGDLHHVVNNAGFTADKMAHTMDDATFELILKVHNTAPFRLLREAAPYFRVKDASKRGNRSVVNVSSTSGLHGNAGQINYAIAKAGVVGMTKTLAKEWGPLGTRVNTVAFGWIATRLTSNKEDGEAIVIGGRTIALGIPGRNPSAAQGPTAMPDIPLGRPGTADEAAMAVLFLASPMASYITGVRCPRILRDSS